MRLYAYLGIQLAGRSSEGHPYRRWIETYGGEEFGRLTRRLEVLLDRIGTDGREVRDGYRYAMQCELDFLAFTAETQRTQRPRRELKI
jgi:thiaminase/transcriptional activator TenA